MNVDDRSISESGYALFALPGQRINIELARTSPSSPAPRTDAVEVSIGTVSRAGEAGNWRWQAPDTPGAYGTLNVKGSTAGSTLQINLFVLVPADDVVDGFIGEYRIDAYPDGAPNEHYQQYAPPVGFVQVTEANRDMLIAPHFRIGQFVPKQEGDWPKYVAPGPRLYKKLERLLSIVRSAGFNADTLHIMSGYRTPFYNRAIGNVAYSRHIYGDAADVFVDIDENELMDDLNGDGTVNVDDARTMAGWLDAGVDQAHDIGGLIGGLGVYDSTDYHGPFIHVDSRGHEARWGMLQAGTN